MTLPIRNQKLLKCEGTEYLVVTADEALSQLPDFGRHFFDQLLGEYPQLRQELIFLRWRFESFSNYEDDVLAVLDRTSGGFGIQIDVALEYIIVWSEVDHGEYGDWGTGNDQIADAMVHVRTCLGSVA